MTISAKDLISGIRKDLKIDEEGISESIVA